MKQIHVLLGIESRFYRELLWRALSAVHWLHLEKVAANQMIVASRLMEILDEPCPSPPDVVVYITSISATATDAVPGSYSRLLQEFPELVIVGICWSTSDIRLYRMTVDVQKVASSLEGLFDQLRRVALTAAVDWQ